jgi:DNA primase
VSVVDEIKERLDIVEVISGYVPLKKAGRNFKGLCPFHTEKTPSFIVFPDSQNWHCFGACSTGGDLFAFVMKKENMTFPEALRFLGQRAGVVIAPRSEAEAAEDEKHRRLQEVVAAAAQYFNHLLLHAPAAEGARAYLTRRAIQPPTVEAFQLGYALDSWDALSHYLGGKGYSLAELHDAGLVIEREGGGGYYDRFRGRLMFPIRDWRGRTVGFGARALDDSLPKYLNSPQTALFDKGRSLYGLDAAKDAIRREGTAVIVEGYPDVIIAHQSGFKNVVASLGTALTEEQLRLLQRFTRRFVLAMDADTAGSEATLRGLEVAKEALNSHPVPVPTWRGLIQYENRLEADIRILILPPGQDPDDVIKASPERWKELVDGALPVVDYYFGALTAGLDLDSAQGKSAAVRRLLPVIQEVGDPVQRAHYVQRLARLVRVDEKTLQEAGGRRQEAGGKRQEARGQEKAEEGRRGAVGSHKGGSYGLEEYLLSCLIKEPWLVAALDNSLRTLGAGGLTVDDFDVVEDQMLFAALRDRLDREPAWAPAEFRDGLVDILQQRLDFLLQRAAQQPPLGHEDTEREAASCLLRLRERHRRRQLSQLRFLLEEAREQQDAAAASQYSQMVNALIGEIKNLQQSHIAYRISHIAGRSGDRR